MFMPTILMLESEKHSDDYLVRLIILSGLKYMFDSVLSKNINDLLATS